jgi:hypothetical protein
MPSKASLALGIGLMAASGYGVAMAWSWPWKAALFPLVIGIPLFCLATVEVLWEFLGRKDSGTEAGGAKDFQISQEVPRAEVVKRGVVAAGWISGFFAAIVLLGFPVAVPLFVLLYLKLEAREGWILSVAMTAAVWALFYGLFDRLLHLPFPQGWLLSLVS